MTLVSPVWYLLWHKWSVSSIPLLVTELLSEKFSGTFGPAEPGPKISVFDPHPVGYSLELLRWTVPQGSPVAQE